MRTVSLCMIVKDEEASLGRCLESIKDEVDEIIIVDTGSKDRTVEIAEKYTDKVFFHEWENSFSKARNISLGYSSSDWIFILDADEELDPGSKGLIRQSINTEGADAFNVGTKSFVNHGKSSTFHKLPRLFKNNGMIFYEGIVHNRVVGYSSLGESEILVQHYGYDGDDAAKMKKHRRTSALLLEQIRRNPDNPDPYTYLSTSYISMEMYDKSLETSQRAIDLMRSQDRYTNIGSVAYYNGAVCLFNSKDFSDMIEIALECQRNYPDDIDTCVVLVFGYRGIEEWGRVVHWGDILFSRAKGYKKLCSRAVMSLSDLWKAYLFVAEAYMHMNRRADAIDHFRHSLSSSNQREICLNAIIRMLLSQNWIEEARPFADMALKEGIYSDAVDALRDREISIEVPSGGRPESHYRDEPKKDGEKVPLLSLCMIVKNESECIERCLESVGPLVDEMVVVDTGSTDDTTEKAGKLGADIYHHEWDDDFSAARNFSISRAKGRWILIMDADEVISSRDREAVRDLIEEGKADAYRFVLRNYVNDLTLANVKANPWDYEEGLGFPGYIPVNLIRLFRADLKAGFSGAVHETLDGSLEDARARVLDSGIPIHHYGKVMESRILQKQQFYQRLGLEKLKDQPDEPAAYKTLSDQCLETGDYARALEVVETGLALFPDLAQLHFNKGLALEMTQDFDGAEFSYRETIKRCANHAGAYNNLAGIYFKKKRYKEALWILETAVTVGINHPVIYYTLGLVHAAMGDCEKAMNSYDKTLELSPGFKKANTQKAHLFLKRNETRRAADCLRREIANKGDMLLSYITLGEIGIFEKDLEEAENNFKKALSIDPDNLIAVRHLNELAGRESMPTC